MAGIDFIRDLAVVMLVAGAAGWLFQRLGLSVVVGYLLAGIVIGPFTPPFPLVEDLDRIQILANVGLIFLLFSIGMGLSFQRLQRLGLPVLLATLLGALLIFSGWRLIGRFLGLTEIQGLFLAGMLVCSSSAIIGKILQETGDSHRKFGQLALGITVLEDMVAIIVLTVLMSYLGVDESGKPAVWHALGFFIAFVVFLGVIGLLVLPRLLRFLSRRAAAEIQTLAVGAILMILALAAHGAGYSLALGAFLAGLIVAETAQRAHVERTFEGMRHIFSAIFFVAIGMLIDPVLLVEVWPWILLVSAGAIVTRTAALGLGLLLMGTSTRDAVRAGLTVTPLGEFSFIIAQAGIAAAVLPPAFYPLAVGASLLTALASTVLIKHSEGIADLVVRLEPRPVRRFLDLYLRLLDRLRHVERRNHLWQRSRKRLIMTVLELFFIGGLLVPAEPVLGLVQEALGENLLFPHGTAVVYWSGLAMILLVPVTLVCRNIYGFAATLEETLRQSREGAKLFPVVMATVVKAVGFMVVMLLLATLLPLGTLGAGVILLLLLLGAAMLFGFRGRFSSLYHQFETEMEEILTPSPPDRKGPLPTSLQSPEEWGLEIKEAVIPDGANCAGRTIGELRLRKRFGTSIMAIDRHDFLIANPSAATALFPGDRLLLLGDDEQIRATREALEATQNVAPEDLMEVSMDTVGVPVGSPLAGKTLIELDIYRRTGVQVAGLKREAETHLNPSGTMRIEEADTLLVLGTASQVRSFRHWIAGVEEEGDSDGFRIP